jgi:ATP-dependent helicase/nuclease subunit A
VQAFFACLDGLDRSNQFSPERMEIEITKLFASPDSAGENVQMMTIHKSKGLEFDTVILPGLGATTGGNNGNKPLILWEEVSINEQTELLAAPYIPKGLRDENVSAYDYLLTLENERETNEDVRVLYVAATRAERKLHLVGIANQNAKEEINPIKNSYLDFLWGAVSPVFEAAELPESVDQNEDNIADFTPNLVRLKQLQIPTVFHRKNSETPNNKPQDVPKLEVKTIEQDCGTLAHLYMEMIANDGLEHWPASRMDIALQGMRFWLLQRGHAKNEVESYVTHIVAALKCTINSPEGSWMLAPRASLQAELSITAMNENEAEEHRIDLTFIENSARWIIDYKFGLDVTQANAHIAAQAYKPQLASYAALFSHENSPIKTAVFFLSLGKLVEI